MSEQSYDIIVVGAGLAGLAMRRALINTPWRVLHLHRKINGGAAPEDDRGLAMSRSSRCILQHLDAWPQDVTAEIRRVKISLSGQFGSALVSDQDIDGGPLGYTVRASAIAGAIARALPAPLDAKVLSLRSREGSVQVRAATADGEINCSAKLLIAADGTSSPTLAMAGRLAKATPYKHHAMVCELHGSYDDPALAIEHLGDDGPIAVLPLAGGKSKLICCMPQDTCSRMANMGEREFMDALRQRTGRLLPPNTSGAGKRSVWPICRNRNEGAGRILPIGNAAMTVHPNAAQGYNLCLRDVAHLAEHISASDDPGAADVLASWKERRRPDHDFVQRLTTTLASFYSPRTIPAPLHAIGLAAFDLLPPLRRRMAWMASGLGAGQLPDSIYAQRSANSH